MSKIEFLMGKLNFMSKALGGEGVGQGAPVSPSPGKEAQGS